MRISRLLAFWSIASLVSPCLGQTAKIDLPEPCRPLFAAAVEGNARKMSRALKTGADPNCRTEPGKTTALMAAVTNATLPTVQALLAVGADPNAQDGAGATSLMFAAQLGRAGVVRALLAKGADPRLQAKNGATALELARGAGHAKVVELLEKAAERR